MCDKDILQLFFGN